MDQSDLRSVRDNNPSYTLPHEKDRYRAHTLGTKWRAFKASHNSSSIIEYISDQKFSICFSHFPVIFFTPPAKGEWKDQPPPDRVPLPKNLRPGRIMSPVRLKHESVPEQTKQER
jgi:hypothetical protein